MIANFFNKTKPINTLAIIVLLFIIYVLSTIINFKELITIPFLLKKASYFLVLILILFTVNFIIRKNHLVKDNSYTLLLFVILLGMFPVTVLSFKLVITNFILLLSYRRIYSLRTQKNTKEKLFDSAFWIGVATLIYPWSSILMLLIYIAIFLFDKRTWRNAIIPIVGLITPIFIYTIFLLLVGDSISTKPFINFDYSFNFESYNSFRLLIPLAIVIAFILWSIFPTTFKILTVNNEFKHSWQLIISHFFILLLVVIPWEDKNGSELLFLFFPMSIIFTNYLQLIEEKWFKEVFLYSFLAMTVLVYFL